MASKVLRFSDDTVLSAILALNKTLENKNSSAVNCVCSTSTYGSKNANISHYEVSLAITHTGDCHHTEASPHDNQWNIDFRACDRRASILDTRCEHSLTESGLEHVRKITRRETTAPPRAAILPDTSVSINPFRDTDFEVNPISHLHLDTVTLSAFTSSVAEDHVLRVFSTQTHDVDGPPYLNTASI